MTTVEEQFEFTPEQLAKYKKEFDALDKKHDHHLDLEELHQLATDLGYEKVTKEDVLFVMKNFDKDHDGTLNYDEFLTFMKLLRKANYDEFEHK
ncbi:hypothetical protein BGW42_001117 [Actinomortierella wolfii]|nr:hypothetical protein BGW42_001117 [Actinomortierella wolfii]